MSTSTSNRGASGSYESNKDYRKVGGVDSALDLSQFAESFMKKYFFMLVKGDAGIESRFDKKLFLQITQNNKCLLGSSQRSDVMDGLFKYTQDASVHVFDLSVANKISNVCISAYGYITGSSKISSLFVETVTLSVAQSDYKITRIDRLYLRPLQPFTEAAQKVVANAQEPQAEPSSLPQQAEHSKPPSRPLSGNKKGGRESAPLNLFTREDAERIKRDFPKMTAGEIRLDNDDSKGFYLKVQAKKTISIQDVVGALRSVNIMCEVAPELREKRLEPLRMYVTFRPFPDIDEFIKACLDKKISTDTLTVCIVKKLQKKRD